MAPEVRTWCGHSLVLGVVTALLMPVLLAHAAVDRVQAALGTVQLLGAHVRLGFLFRLARRRGLVAHRLSVLGIERAPGWRLAITRLLGFEQLARVGEGFFRRDPMRLAGARGAAIGVARRGRGGSAEVGRHAIGGLEGGPGVGARRPAAL